jgi:phage baseplate assembly protein W
VAAMDNDTAFLGTGWSFPPEFSLRAGVRMVSAQEDIKQSLYIVLATAPGERVMRPAFGAGIRQQVFNSIDTTTVTILKDTIARAILFFEPRVKVEAIDADTAMALEGRLDLSITYTIISSNTRHNIVYPFYCLEGSDVQI